MISEGAWSKRGVGELANECSKDRKAADCFVKKYVLHAQALHVSLIEPIFHAVTLPDILIHNEKSNGGYENGAYIC